MPVDDVVDVIAMGNGFVTATGAMGVGGIVAAASVIGCARRWVVAADRELVLVDMIAMRMVQMAVMQVVDVTVMLDLGVAAVSAMLVVVIVVGVAAHTMLRVLSGSHFADMVEGVSDDAEHMLVGEAVVDVLAAAFAADDALLVQQLETLRDGAHALSLGQQLGHARFARLPQLMQQLQPRAVSKRAKQRAGAHRKLFVELERQCRMLAVGLFVGTVHHFVN